MDTVHLCQTLPAPAMGVAPRHVATLRDSLPRWRRRTFWSFQAVFWLAIFMAVLGLTMGLRPAETTVLSIVLRAGVGFAISSLVYLLFETPRLRGLPRRVRWPLMAVVATAGVVASMLLLMVGVMDGPSERTLTVTFWGLVPRFIAAGFWCASVFGLEVIQDLYHTEIHLAEAEATAIDLELRMLKAEAVARTFELRHLQDQMNPHFLFNALNAVVASRHDPEAVENVTRDLADYLRFTLGEARTFEPLSRELQALEKYLAVQQTRFGENLVCRIACDRASHSVLVPPMLIQPILENALLYGAKTSTMPLKVEVTARVTEGWLEVVVANSGRWLPPDTSRSPSTGIHSLRRRLALLVNDAATVDTVLDPALDGGWVRVVIRMPATLDRPSPPGADPAPSTGVV